MDDDVLANVERQAAKGEVASSETPAPSESGSRGRFDPLRVYGVPTQFSLGVVLVAMTATALLFAGCRAADFPRGTEGVLAGLLFFLAIAQWWGSRHPELVSDPRQLSIVAGAIYCGVANAIVTAIATVQNRFFNQAWLLEVAVGGLLGFGIGAVVGLFIGYLGGALVAGLFLLIDLIDDLRHGHSSTTELKKQLGLAPVGGAPADIQVAAPSGMAAVPVRIVSPPTHRQPRFTLGSLLLCVTVAAVAMSSMQLRFVTDDARRTDQTGVAVVLGILVSTIWALFTFGQSSRSLLLAMLLGPVIGAGVGVLLVNPAPRALLIGCVVILAQAVLLSRQRRSGNHPIWTLPAESSMKEAPPVGR